MGKYVRFKLDTEAEISVLQNYIFKEIIARKPNKKINKSKVSVVAYESPDFLIKPIGTVNMPCYSKNLGCDVIVQFAVVDMGSDCLIPLLGLLDCVSLNLVRCIDVISQKQFVNLDDVIKTYKPVFVGLGKMPIPYKISLEDNVKPHISPPR